MKLITAIIKPDKVEALRQALTGVDIQGLTIVEAKGYGRQKGHTELYRGAEYEVHFLPKSRAEVLVDSADVEKVITTISEAVKSGKIGDGKIFVTEVQEVVLSRLYLLTHAFPQSMPRHRCECPSSKTHCLYWGFPTVQRIHYYICCTIQKLSKVQIGCFTTIQVHGCSTMALP